MLTIVSAPNFLVRNITIINEIHLLWYDIHIMKIKKSN